jgi:voltage-gated potassium channel Kch
MGSSRPQFTLSERLRYAFDRTIAGGTMGLVAWLGLATLLVAVACGLIILLLGIAPTDSAPLELPEALWTSLGQAFVPTVPLENGWSYRAVMFMASLGGLLVTSSLIGVLTAGMEGKIEQLRKGRTKVVEENHTVLLGWSEETLAVVSELVEANAHRDRSCVAILAPRDKVEMEDALREHVGSTKRTRVVCRTGDPIELSSLDIVSLNTSKSIIVLSPEGDDPDGQVLKTLMAIARNPNRRPEPFHIMAELRRPENLSLAKLIAGDEVETVLAGELTARILAQTCRQSGLSVIYTELLDFGGDEIYFSEAPALVGKTFAETLLSYERAAVMGLAPAGGTPALNPPMDTVLKPGDRLVVIAENDLAIQLRQGPPPAVDEAAIQLRTPAVPTPEQTLVVGWNWRAPIVIRELDAYVAPGSEVVVLHDFAGSEANLPPLKNQKVTVVQGNGTDRPVLESISPPRFKHIIVLACSDTLDRQEADTRSLVTLLHLRDILQRADRKPSIVSEMLDLRNRALAETAQGDDFVVSDRMVGLLLAQGSENKALCAVFADLFDSDGSEIYLKLAANYVTVGQQIQFATLVEAARRKGEIAIGYRIEAHHSDASRAFGVVLNPAKSTPVTFEGYDRVIVVANA